MDAAVFASTAMAGLYWALASSKARKQTPPEAAAAEVLHDKRKLDTSTAEADVCFHKLRRLRDLFPDMSVYERLVADAQVMCHHVLGGRVAALQAIYVTSRTIS